MSEPIVKALEDAMLASNALLHERDQLRAELADAVQRAKCTERDRDAVLAANATLNDERRTLLQRAEAAEAALAAVPKDAISTVVCAAEPHLTDPRHRAALDAIRHWAHRQPKVQP